MNLMTRRNFLRSVVYGTPAVFAAEAHFVESTWLTVKQVRLSDTPGVRLVHFSDLHYKGNKSYLSDVIERINDLSPDVACFTGDIVEKVVHLDEALELLSRINCPLYGVPGNHEYWSNAPFAKIEACFKATGGDWLPDRVALTRDKRCLLEGLSGVTRGVQLNDRTRLLLEAAGSDAEAPAEEAKGIKRILLTHYPATANHLGDAKYDLILAGHSHGGQIRLPFIGALILPGDVDGYDAGLYDTPAGPLYVNVGIGTWHLPVRFLCRPEITVLEI